MRYMECATPFKTAFYNMLSWWICRCFETFKQICKHVTKEHFESNLAPTHICQWAGCDRLPRQRWSFMTHLQVCKRYFNCSEINDVSIELLCLQGLSLDAKRVLLLDALLIVCEAQRQISWLNANRCHSLPVIIAMFIVVTGSSYWQPLLNLLIILGELLRYKSDTEVLRCFLC
jgi:hypothetical protein